MKDIPKKYREVEEFIDSFEKLQEERVKTYRLFEKGNKEYLNSGPNYNFVEYREVVNNVTKEFKRISEGIISLEKSLREASATDIADIISNVQDCEKRKLELTVEHYLSQQMVADSDGNELEKTTEREIRLKLFRVVEEINDNLSELRYLLYEG